MTAKPNFRIFDLFEFHFCLDQNENQPYIKGKLFHAKILACLYHGQLLYTTSITSLLQNFLKQLLSHEMTVQRLFHVSLIYKTVMICFEEARVCQLCVYHYKMKVLHKLAAQAVLCCRKLGFIDIHLIALLSRLQLAKTQNYSV